jgi:hypothetical protein
MAEVTKARHVIDRRAGHVQLRRAAAGGSGEDWAVRLFNGAERLQAPAPVRRA